MVSCLWGNDGDDDDDDDDGDDGDDGDDDDDGEREFCLNGYPSLALSCGCCGVLFFSIGLANGPGMDQLWFLHISVSSFIEANCLKVVASTIIDPSKHSSLMKSPVEGEAL